MTSTDVDCFNQLPGRRNSMKFFTRSKDGTFECQLLAEKDGKEEKVFHLQVPDITLDCWDMAVGKWLSQKSHKAELLITQAGQINICQFPGVPYPPGSESIETYLIFLRVLCALARSLDNKIWPDNADYLRQAILQYLTKNKLFNIITSPQQNDSYRLGFDIAGRTIHLYFNEVTGGEALFLCWKRWLSDETCSRNTIETILSNLDLMDEIVHLRTSTYSSNPDARLLLQSYTNFTKALIKFLDDNQDPRIIAFRRKLAYYYASIVMSPDTDPEEKRNYLDNIFHDRHLDTNERNYLLGKIFRQLKMENTTDQKPSLHLLVVTSAITQYYLKQYDLERVAEIWHRIGLQWDLLLRLILLLYRMPLPYLGGLIFLCILTIVPCFYPSLPGWAERTFALIVGFLLTIALMTSSFTIFILLLRHVLSRETQYFELFMPRLLGAVAVGLSILVFESTVWDVSLQISWPNCLLICVANYSIALSYIFMDVQRTLRFLPLREGEIDWQTVPKKGKNRKSPALKTTWKIFCIGLFEAFIASLFISSLLGSSTIHDHVCQWQCGGKELFQLGTLLSAGTLKGDDQQFFGFIFKVGDSFSLVYFPKLLLLWTGLSLLIGTFVQLLWQDRQITSL